MKYVFSEQAWEDYLFGQKTDKRVLKRINKLVKEISRDSFRGTGKPEPLKHALSGYWSRRITEADRIVYKVEGNSLYVAQLRYHY